MVEAMEVIVLPAQEGELSSSGCFLDLRQKENVSFWEN